MSKAATILEMLSTNESSKIVVSTTGGSDHNHEKLRKILDKEYIEYTTRSQYGSEEFIISKSDMNKVQRIADRTSGENDDNPFEVKFTGLDGRPV